MKTPRLEEFSVDEAVKEILDETSSIGIRAIHLYSLQLAILTSVDLKLSHSGVQRKRSGPPPRSKKGLAIYIRRYNARVRMYACTKLMQYFEGEQPDTSPLQLLSENKTYAALYEFFVLNRGWVSLRTASPTRDYQEFIDQKALEARDTAKAIAFSARFEPFPGRRIAGGVNTARTVLESLRIEEAPLEPECKVFRPKRSDATLKNYWRRHRHVAAFLYLGYFEKIKLLVPPKLTAEDFARNLIDRTSDRSALVNCFNRHNALCARLRDRRIQNPLISHEALEKSYLEQLPPLPEYLSSLAKSTG